MGSGPIWRLLEGDAGGRGPDSNLRPRVNGKVRPLTQRAEGSIKGVFWK